MYDTLNKILILNHILQDYDWLNNIH